MKTIDLTQAEQKLIATDLMQHLISDVKLWCDTGNNMLVFTHMCSLLVTPRSMAILLASALCGLPMPKTSNPPNKLCDFALQTMQQCDFAAAESSLGA